MRIRIDLKIFIFLVIFYFTKQIELYGLVMLFAILHEIGHLIAGLICGFKPDKIKIMPIGLSISFKIPIEYYNEKIEKSNLLCLKKAMIAIAGPLTNVIIAGIFMFFKFGMYDLDRLNIVYSNLLICVFNLLPIYPLDGGRILKQLVKLKKGVVYSLKIVHIVQNITIITLTFISSIAILYFKNIAILFVLVYLWILVIKENKIWNIWKALDLFGFKI